MQHGLLIRALYEEWQQMQAEGKPANEMFDLLIAQYAAREGFTEQLKTQNQMEWVRQMNSIRGRVEEVI